MKSFDTFFKETTKYHLETSSSSLTTYAAMIKLINNYRDKEWATLYLFYSNTSKNIGLNNDGMLLIKPLIEKYKTWSNLEAEFKKNENSLVRDFKPLKSYKLYLKAQEAKEEYLSLILKEVQDMKTSDLAKMLNVSQNVASAFKRGEVNRVSYEKVLAAKIGRK